MNRLEENKIFFNNPKKLALHVKKIWINPKDWWNSKKVKKEIKSLENSSFKIKKDWLQEWSQLIQEL